MYLPADFVRRIRWKWIEGDRDLLARFVAAAEMASRTILDGFFVGICSLARSRLRPPTACFVAAFFERGLERVKNFYTPAQRFGKIRSPTACHEFLKSRSYRVSAAVKECSSSERKVEAIFRWESGQDICRAAA